MSFHTVISCMNDRNRRSALDDLTDRLGAEFVEPIARFYHAMRGFMRKGPAWEISSCGNLCSEELLV